MINKYKSIRVLSQQASGACDASQFSPDRLVQSITGVAVQLQLENVKQSMIVLEITASVNCLTLPATTYCQDDKLLKTAGSAGHVSLGS